MDLKEVESTWNTLVQNEQRLKQKFLGCRKQNGTILKECGQCAEIFGSRGCERYRDKYYMTLITDQGKQASCEVCTHWTKIQASEQIPGLCVTNNIKKHRESDCIHFEEVTA